MIRYASFDPEAQVIGQAMLGFKAATSKKIIEPLLKKHELMDIQPEQWYPLQKWLDVLSDIEINAGASSMLTFVDIGIGVAANVAMPAEGEQLIKEKGIIDSLVAFGASNYYRDHQGNVGQVTHTKNNDQQLTSTILTPYPPDFWYGIMYGAVKRWSKSCIVQYEDLSMRHPKPGEPVIVHTLVNT